MSAEPLGERSPVLERRRDRRMEIKMAVAMGRRAGDGRGLLRGMTRNVSTGGVYLESAAPGFEPGDRVEVELTVPPSEGVSSSPGTATCAAEIVRVQAASRSTDGEVGRVGIAARFLDRLRISF